MSGCLVVSYVVDVVVMLVTIQVCAVAYGAVVLLPAMGPLLCFAWEMVVVMVWATELLVLLGSVDVVV